MAATRGRSVQRLSAVILMAFALVQAPRAEAGDTPSSFDLYRSGRVGEALSEAKRELATAEAQVAPGAVWRHLMYVAWLEESLGDHRGAIETATRSLEQAATLGDAFKIGRSLCWLGWSATSLGLYPLALEFYADAIATATEGDAVVHPMVWGLATQEKGAILAKMGQLEQGAALIASTTDYARRNDIAVGVAEGGAHLAGIALQRGDLEAAQELADEALQASLRCGCSAYNTNRARVVQARIALERARTTPELRSLAQEKILSALAGAEKVRDLRHIAEARLLYNYVIDPDDLQRRTELVSSAADLLHETESELRGTADGHLGSLLLESDQVDLAAVYLRSGFEINEDLLRRVDSAYTLGDLAQIDEIDGDNQAALEKWMEVSSRAEEAGAWPIAAESQERLSEYLLALGFLRLSLHWTEKALDSIERLLENSRDAERRADLVRRELRLGERIVELELELGHPPPAAPE